MLKLPDECGPIIADHTKQHCHNKRLLLLKPEPLWSYRCKITDMFYVIPLRTTEVTKCCEQAKGIEVTRVVIIF